ncbi:hypothetical protein S40293_11305 [Stachybotrys chartarum IBT 40293]|nr:hypothetical protein S40293_11305 [Stachybotrys chartarum IBT 40293]
MPEGYDAIGRDATLGLGEPDKMRRPPISRRADPPRGSVLDGVRVGSPDGPAVGAGHNGAPAREALQGRGAGVAAGQHADARKAEFREPLLLTSNCKSMPRKRGIDEEYAGLFKVMLLSTTARKLGLRRNDGCEAGRLMAAATKHRWGPGKSVRLGSEPRDVPALEEVDGRLAREAAAADGGRGKYELLLWYNAAENSRSVAISFVDMVDEPEDPILPEQRTADGGLAADTEDKETTATFAEGQGDGDSKHHALRRDADEATTVLADLLDKPRNVLEEIFGPPPESQYVEKTGRWIPRGQPGLGWLWCGDDVGNHAWVGINGHVCIGEEMSIWLFPVVEAMGTWI